MRCRGSGLKPLDSSSEETEHDQDGTGGSNQCSRGRGDTCVHEETGCRDLQKFSPTLLHPVIFSSPFFLLVSASPCLSLCNHLLANLLQNTVILNVCSSTSLTIFFSLILSIFLAGKADQHNDNIEHNEMVYFTPKPIIHCSAFRYQPFSYFLSLQDAETQISPFFYSTLPSSPLGREGHIIYL